MLIIEGNLLEFKVECIVHQTNCVSKGSSGLARQLFKKYPWANVYQQRRNRSTPGTIDFRSNGEKVIAAFYSQYYPGKSKHPNDSPQHRLLYFRNCLQALSKKEYSSVAFPYGIGCGLAGGDWKVYYNEIVAFSKAVIGKTKVYIVKLP